jgi:hypothetical protein
LTNNKKRYGAKFSIIINTYIKVMLVVEVISLNIDVIMLKISVGRYNIKEAVIEYIPKCCVISDNPNIKNEYITNSVADLNRVFLS